MSIFDQVSEDIKKAMLAKERVKLDALRSIKKEFIEAKTSKTSHGELSDETAVTIMQKMVKQRRDSADIYTTQARPDLAEKELEELAVIEAYLPKQLSPEELDAELTKLIAEVGAKSPADMGKVMGAATKKLAGVSNGKAISEAVKRLLS
ncbi:MAG: GatB/YqeY domain-containing protein [Dysgonamonadaceae bacterium]